MYRLFFAPSKINRLWFKSFRTLPFIARRNVSQMAKSLMAIKSQEELCYDAPSRGLVLGVYTDEEDNQHTGVLTPSAWKYNKQVTKGRLFEHMKVAGPAPRRGECRLFYAIECVDHPTYSVVCIAGLGKECLGFDSYQRLDEGKEAIRRAAGTGCVELQKLGVDRIDIENMGHAESAAEGAALGIWAYQEYRNLYNRMEVPTIDIYFTPDEECDWEGWKIGLQKAAAQNLARQLQETPSNFLTPTNFAQNVVEVLCKSGVNVEMKVSGWAESQQMNSFLAVSRASCEPPIFLELSYYGASSDERPIVMVGQGVTYDTGGICLKGLGDLQISRGDMTGAAVVVATCRAIASMRLPINIRGLIPLCENSLGCNSYKPGDVYKAMNGKHIEVQCSNHEDTLVMADALLYAQNFCPRFILDVGTMGKSARESLGEAATGVFTNSEYLWQQIKNASYHTGDRVWKMPLWNYYSKAIRATDIADMVSHGHQIGGNMCKKAAILREFVPCGQWIHVDASNVMTTNGLNFEYLRKGFAGRPTRTLIEFIAQTMCNDDRPKAPTRP